ncbi:hypothetical protein [Pedobacter agri]|uniref:hypothetical protein n=1 Tax=Pedobacter agri TaxID=454586 RepID=UPI00292D776A|nr:hypothetical protein [Pedobacter agri]
MKKLIPSLCVAVTLMMACQSKNTSSGTGDSTTTTSSEDITSTQCYQSIKNRDTATVSLNIENEKVTGSLSYNLFEKDKNNGVVAGIVKGDTIIADYTFQSEGSTSIRQVAWLKQNNQLIEGFGDVEEVDGKTKFKDLGKLNFDKSLVFSKIDCK